MVCEEHLAAKVMARWNNIDLSRSLRAVADSSKSLQWRRSQASRLGASQTISGRPSLQLAPRDLSQPKQQQPGPLGESVVDDPASETDQQLGAPDAVAVAAEGPRAEPLLRLSSCGSSVDMEEGVARPDSPPMIYSIIGNEADGSSEDEQNEELKDEAKRSSAASAPISPVAQRPEALSLVRPDQAFAMGQQMAARADAAASLAPAPHSSPGGSTLGSRALVTVNSTNSHGLAKSIAAAWREDRTVSAPSAIANYAGAQGGEKWELPADSVESEELTMEVSAVRLGMFKFKGSPDLVSVVHITASNLASRR